MKWRGLYTGCGLASIMGSSLDLHFNVQPAAQTPALTLDAMHSAFDKELFVWCTQHLHPSSLEYQGLATLAARVTDLNLVSGFR
jgi:hypothetical protein